MDALAELGRQLKKAGYAFVTVSPETHRRVEERAKAQGRREGRDLRDVFGWSRPFRREILPSALLALADRAGILRAEGELVRATVRFSSLHGRLFVHSAYPTTAEDAVFFGPDTYRFCDLVSREVAGGPRRRRAVDVGCGCGAGALAAHPYVDALVFADVNPHALAFAEVNASMADVPGGEFVRSDVLAGVDGAIDLVLANPPYMADPLARAYRHGGGELGEGLAVRIAAEALARLAPGGQLILYTGAPVVDGRDLFLEAARDVCARAGATWTYREIDPDVFGEEITDNDAYANADRIAAVALVATVS